MQRKTSATHRVSPQESGSWKMTVLAYMSLADFPPAHGECLETAAVVKREVSVYFFFISLETEMI